MSNANEALDTAILQIRRRRSPSQKVQMYGQSAPFMIKGEKFFQDVRDRAAYVYITGYFPTHLRSTYTGVLREISRPYRRPSSLDGRIGNIIIHASVAVDLALDAHPMVLAVRKKIREGYLIQAGRRGITRRSYARIFMFRLNSENCRYGGITVNIDGAVRQGH